MSLFKQRHNSEKARFSFLDTEGSSYAISLVTGNYYGVVQDKCASSHSMTSADRGSSATVSRELCPDATSEQISQSLNNSKGDVNLAAQELLGLSDEASDLAMGEH